MMKKMIFILVAVGIAFSAGCDYINETMVEAPRLVNMSLDAAKIITEERGLELVVVEKIASDIVAKNSIISQEPSPNTLIKMSREVFVTISKGRKNTVLKNYSGMRFGEAQKHILENGLSIGGIDEIYSKSTDTGIVIDQFPAPGSTVDQNTPIMLTVSLGYMIKIPDVIGMDYQEAVSRLIEEGFDAKNIVTKKTSARFVPFNGVVRQDPEPGMMLDPSSPIFIFYNAP